MINRAGWKRRACHTALEIGVDRLGKLEGCSPLVRYAGDAYRSSGDWNFGEREGESGSCGWPLASLGGLIDPDAEFIFLQGHGCSVRTALSMNAVPSWDITGQHTIHFHLLALPKIPVPLLLYASASIPHKGGNILPVWPRAVNTYFQRLYGKLGVSSGAIDHRVMAEYLTWTSRPGAQLGRRIASPSSGDSPRRVVRRRGNVPDGHDRLFSSLSTHAQKPQTGSCTVTLKETWKKKFSPDPTIRA